MRDRVYEFHVQDGPGQADGYWGDLRQKAKSQEEAEALCRRYLDDNHLFPDGTIDPPYCLTLYAIDGAPVED
jgi:hypothetical protein